ncbi:MAG: hypothetical protein LBR26_11250 [Prevotella sp.]|nr:hypothetical protein [Prevotella sp.]
MNLLGDRHTDIKTLAALPSHSGRKYIAEYTRAVDLLIEKAVNALPELTV